MEDNKHGDVQRKPSEDVESFEDPLQHLWAISYADLLMVILAFFVVYDVSPKKENIETKIEKTALGDTLTKMKNKLFAKPDSQSPAEAEAAQEQKIEGYNDLKEILKNHEDTRVQMVTNDEYHEVLIHFGDEYFRSGQYMPSKRLEEKLVKITSDIKGLSGQFLLEVIGHADSTPVSQRLIDKGVTSNTILSALRAAYAGEVIAKAGFDGDHIIISGHGSKGYKLKTLTIRLKDLSTASNEGFTPHAE